MQGRGGKVDIDAISYLLGKICNLEVEYKEKSNKERHWDRKRGRREKDKRVTRLGQTKQEKITRESPQNVDTALMKHTDQGLANTQAGPGAHLSKCCLTNPS